MKERIRPWLDRLRDNFLLIPGLMAGVALIAGAVIPKLELETDLLADIEFLWFVFDAGPEGARQVLATIAASLITVAGTVFSITIATLTLTSQNFGPRLLRTFTRDRGVQVTLGTFVAGFVFPLLALRTVRTLEDESFVPQLSVVISLVLAVLAIGVLIYFIDHIATMVRAPQVIAAAGHELDDTLDEVIPRDGKQGDSDDDGDRLNEPAIPARDAHVVTRAHRPGYVTVIVVDRLISAARKHDVVLRLDVGTGSYVSEGQPLARSHPPATRNDELAEEIVSAFNIGHRRTVAQDATYAIDQLVEIAARALSTGLNDPFTAMTCVDRLAAGFCRIIDRPFPDPRKRDKEGRLRVVTRRPTFRYLVEISFRSIRRHASEQPALLVRILEALCRIAEQCPPQRLERLAPLAREVRAIRRIGWRFDRGDRRLLEEWRARFYGIARRKLEERNAITSPGTGPGSP